MPRFILMTVASVFLCFGAVQAAFADDGRMPHGVGCYLGLNVGAGWQKNTSYDIGANVGSDTGTGAVGGGQIGCDYKIASKWQVGVQGLYDAAGVNGSHPYTAVPTETLGFKTQSIATLTARLGYEFTPKTLLFLKGGAAWVHSKYSDVDPSSAQYGFPYAGQASITRTGWTVGVGGEYKLQHNLSAFIEYDYIGLRSRDVALSYDCGSCGGLSGFSNPYTFSEKQSAHMLLIGLNYNFGGN